MSVTLPPEARKALEYIGIDWPATDEDVLKGFAPQWRTIAGKLDDEAAALEGAVTRLDQHNDGAGMTAFSTYAGDQDAVAKVLRDSAEGCRQMAGGCEIAAGVVEGFKLAAIANLGSLIAAMVAAAAATGATVGFGAPLAAAGLALARKVAFDAIMTAMTDAAAKLLAGDTAPSSSCPS